MQCRIHAPNFSNSLTSNNITKWKVGNPLSLFYNEEKRSMQKKWAELFEKWLVANRHRRVYGWESLWIWFFEQIQSIAGSREVAPAWLNQLKNVDPLRNRQAWLQEETYGRKAGRRRISYYKVKNFEVCRTCTWSRICDPRWIIEYVPTANSSRLHCCWVNARSLLVQSHRSRSSSENKKAPKSEGGTANYFKLFSPDQALW